MRDIEKIARRATAVLNRRPSVVGDWKTLGPNFWSSDALTTAVKSVLHNLKTLGLAGDAARYDLSELIGEKTRTGWGVHRLFAQETPHPLLLTERIAKKLESLSGKAIAVSAVKAIIKVYLAGRIEHFRQCARCGRWFFAGRSDQRYCGASCRSLRWQMTSGRDSHSVAYRKWWLKEVGLPNVRLKLMKLPKCRTLARRDEKRKQGYLAKQARYTEELEELNKLQQRKENER